MSINPFKAVSDYPSMLNKIAVFTLVVSVAATWILRSNISQLNIILSGIDFPTPVAGVTIPLGYLLPAVVVAVFFRVFKIHDRISDIFGIREQFDLFEILIPMAAGVGIEIDLDKRDRLRHRRGEIMGEVFYKYATSSKGKAAIDPHFITMALDQWSWYWILVEASAVIGITAFALWLAGAHKIVNYLLLLFLVFLIVLQPVRHLCSRYAHQEVRAILEDNARRQAIRAVFSAL